MRVWASAISPDSIIASRVPTMWNTSQSISYGNRRGVSLRRADVDARFPGLLDAIASAGPLEGAADSDGPAPG